MLECSSPPPKHVIYNVLCVMCHMSCVKCRMSHATCHMLFFSFQTKWWSLLVEGLLSAVPTLSSFSQDWAWVESSGQIAYSLNWQTKRIFFALRILFFLFWNDSKTVNFFLTFEFFGFFDNFWHILEFWGF